MNQPAVAWVVLVLGSMTAGACVVGVLVVKRAFELPVAVVGIVGFGTSAYALATLPRIYDRADTALWALLFMAAAGAGGYSLASTLLHRLARSPALPPITSGESPARRETAVILTACIEPQSYQSRSTAGMLQQLADEDLLEASVALLPFLFFAQKARYRAIADRSPANGELVMTADRLQAALGEGRFVRWATCSGTESIDRAVIEVVNGGYRSIVVAGLSIADPVHYIAARNAVADLRLEAAGVAVTFTPPLFDSDRIMAMLATRVVEASSGPETGVVLVGHGQPEERSRRNPDFDEHELSFLSRLRMLLLERGMSEESVKVAWADWSTPDVTSSIRHLAALGMRRVLVMPAVFPLDTLATRLDLEMAVRQARVDKSVSVVTMPAWKDDDAVVGELRERIVEAERPSAS